MTGVGRRQPFPFGGHGFLCDADNEYHVHMKRMTLKDIKAYQPTSEELERAKTFKNTDFSDCPKMTKEDLEKFHRVGSIYKPLKKPHNAQAR